VVKHAENFLNIFLYFDINNCLLLKSFVQKSNLEVNVVIIEASHSYVWREGPDSWGNKARRQTCLRCAVVDETFMRGPTTHHGEDATVGLGPIRHEVKH
jgi:hypothetical protein